MIDLIEQDPIAKMLYKKEKALRLSANFYEDMASKARKRAYETEQEIIKRLDSQL